MGENNCTPSLETAPAPALLVGIGASAGGLEALRAFFSALRADSGLSFVLVQHLEPSRDTLLPDLLRAVTPLPVAFISDATVPQPDHIYIAPPQTVISLEQGRLRLGEQVGSKAQQTLIDTFFHTLAEDRQMRAVGIVLSGAGTDGTLGLKAIADAGGMTLAQDSASAAFDSMPRSAATTGVADHVLAPEAMPALLLDYLQHLHALSDPQQPPLPEQIAELLPVICEQLHQDTGHDFRHYKTRTLLRRIQRRMQILAVASASAYLDHLRNDASERQALFKELLISVTAFFRDPDAFATLAQEVMTPLFAQRPTHEPVRIWVPGCASGEEAYTLAILVREQLDRLAQPPDVQIFATDIDERALAQARQGIYPSGIAEDLTDARLQRFFIKKGQRYHVAKELRELCLFSLHNLISDPPFSRLDLISCRNLLIYLGSHLQDKLIPLFHYALKPGGYLFLGPSENLNAHRELFRPLHVRHRISQRRATVVRAPARAVSASAARSGTLSSLPVHERETDIAQIAQRILLDEFAPCYAVINEQAHIIYVSAGTGKYLEAEAGPFRNNLVKLARDGLRVGLRSALNHARKSRRKTVQDDLAIRTTAGSQRVQLTVQPMPQLGEDTELYMVVFQDLGQPLSGPEPDPTRAPVRADALLDQLERELATTRTELEQTIQDLEAANEELKSSNEELLSMNEELQSTNEELETAKEEILSSHEALSRIHSDLENLLASTRIATLFLNDEQIIQSFTPATADIYNLIPSDIGRPLAHITHRLRNMPPLPAAFTLDPERPLEHELATEDGRWLVRRVLPYRDHHGQRHGMVVTFTDITALHASEQRAAERLAEIEALYASAPVGLCFLDTELRFVRINERLAEINGPSVAEHLGRSLREVLPALANTAEPLLQQVIISGEPVLDLELRGETPAQPGVERVWLESWHPQKDAAGRVCGINIVAQEVTERLANERRLRDSEGFLRNVLNGLFAFVGVCTPDGVLIEANHAALDAAGLQPEDVLGKPFVNTYWWSYDPAVQAQLQQAIDRAVQGQPSRYDVQIRLSSDHYVIIDFQIVPMRDSSGRITHLLPSAIDITERKRTLDALRESEQRFRVMADTIPEIIFTDTPDGRCDYLNARYYELTGQPPGSMLGLAWLHSLHPDDQEPTQRRWREALAKGEPYESRYRLRLVDGRYRWFLARSRPVRNDAGQIVRWFGSSADIHGLMLAEQALQDARQAADAANRSKSEFLANMSHEIRTPMTAILGYADLLLQHLQNGDDLESVQTIKRNGRYLVEIINDILDLSKIEAGKLELRRERFSPQELVSDVLSLMEVRAQEKDLHLLIDYQSLLPETIDSDLIRLRQILVNLLGNAIKFTERGSIHLQIQLRDETTGPLLQFSVIDTGIGIAPAQQQRLFTPFTQADASTTRQYGGTGLGLAISRRLVEMLGGSIDFTSVPGQGSTFVFTLPTGPLDGVALVEPQSDSELLETDPALPDLPDHLHCRILLADDRRDIRQLTRRVLSAAGAEVHEVANGRGAIEAVAHAQQQQQAFDLVLMDMQMPELDGYAATAQLRSRGFTGPIIALTAGAMKGDRERCIAAGCNDYLSKPIDRRRLIEIVSRYCQQPPSPPAANKAGLRVLIVDDNQDASDALNLLLGMLEHDTRTADDGATALACARTFQPEVVLLDLGLPDMSGYEVVSQMKVLPGLEQTVFIALTGRAEDPQQTQAAGFHHHVQKPADLGTLLALFPAQN